ncbi:MAG TPA: hypothetical protein QGH10_09545 [Armatimonadota bacterium]|nr:hypothetical protein [Armatimonadota bacterium]
MMDRDTLYVSWTMDCETIGEECITGGPADWALSERAMSGYVEALADRGHRATLFLIPRLAEVQADVATDLAMAGADLGMHMHPQTTDFGHDRHLGELAADEQREILRVGRDRVGAAIGATPKSFRPGCFSATDDTFPILAGLGFSQGSVSLPGRNRPEIGATWVGAEPFAHQASRESRLSAGDLPFIEMPTAVDLRDINRPADEIADARHLRLERDDILQLSEDLIRRHVARQIELDWWLKSVVVMTHNTREYGDPAEPARQALEAVADAIEAAASEAGLEVRPATLAEIADAASEKTRAGSRGG